MDSNSGSLANSNLSDISNVFADTSILLNFAQQEVETDFSSKIIESGSLEVVVGATVAREIKSVRDRRSDIYEDFVDFVLDEEDKISEYSPASRRTYFDDNDREHIRDLQRVLLRYDSRAEIQRILRNFTRAVERRIDYIQEEIISKSKFDQQPAMTVLFTLDPAIPNKDDRKVVGDAALWAAEAEDSSGVFVTKDSQDIIRYSEEVNTALREVRNEAWELLIIHPKDMPVNAESHDETKAPSQPAED